MRYPVDNPEAKEVEYYSWVELESYVYKIIDRMGKWRPDFIYGIPRGGLIPAVMISHKLGDVPVLTSFDNLEEKLKSGKEVLIVDDISDSGETLAEFVDHLDTHYDPQLIRTACITIKRSTNYVPDFYAVVAEDNIWVTYPWEE